MQLLYFQTIFSFVVLGLSIAALTLSLNFVKETHNLILPDSPKATLDLQKVFLPPIKSMQLFVFFFDLFVAL